MSAAIEQARESFIDKARELRDEKNANAKAHYDAILVKAQAMLDKKVEQATASYEDFVGKVEDDIAKRLNIVNKVIDAEAEERVFNEDQAQQKVEAEEREAAEKKMRDDAEAARLKEEARLAKIEAKKVLKAKKKELAMRAKVPIPQGWVNVENSKKLAGKLKKINKAGRYAMCCFYQKKQKKFVQYCQGLCEEFNENVAWFGCEIKENDNFEAAMLLWEFNGTPCIVVCKEGVASNLHRYVIGHTDDTKETTRRYAEKADAE